MAFISTSRLVMHCSSVAPPFPAGGGAWGRCGLSCVCACVWPCACENGCEQWRTRVQRIFATHALGYVPGVCSLPTVLLHAALPPLLRRLFDFAMHGVSGPHCVECSRPAHLCVRWRCWWGRACTWRCERLHLAIQRPLTCAAPPTRCYTVRCMRHTPPNCPSISPLPSTCVRIRLYSTRLDAR